MVERLLDRLDALGPLRAPEARHRRPARRRLGPARQAGARRLRRPRRHRDRGALARPRPALRPALRLADRHGAAAGGGGGDPVPPGHARRTRSRRRNSRSSTPPTSPPSGSGTASACRPPPTRHGRRLYSRTGDDISRAFPDLVDALDFDAALDGELLVRRDDGSIAPFSDLQQRLNRKTVTPAQLRRYPAHLRAYDLLQDGPRDLRPLPFAERRAALEALVATPRPGPLRPLAAPALRDLGRPRRASRRAARADHRGRDAEAARQPLCPRPTEGPVVQVEARPAHRSTRC